MDQDKSTEVLRVTRPDAGQRHDTSADIHSAPVEIPLVVDLDGTLIRTDMLHESFFASAQNGFRHYWSTVTALRNGKACLKAYLADASTIDPDLLPYNPEVLDLIREAKSEGRRVSLATASDRGHAEAIAAHLGLFDGIFASDGIVNLAGATKARVLIDALGDRCFDYVGNDHADLPIWSHARKALVVTNSVALKRQVDLLGGPVEQVDVSRPSLRAWLKALRIHQYAKNVLIFVPLLTAHAYAPHYILEALFAFVSFSLCASSVYLLNDLIDLRADRQHPTKQRRPFACGAIPLVHGVIANSNSVGDCLRSGSLDIASIYRNTHGIFCTDRRLFIYT